MEKVLIDITFDLLYKQGYVATNSEQKQPKQMP